MNNNDKIQIAKMRSLMERMDNHFETNDTMMLNESKLISEATSSNRRQVTRDEIIDIMNKMDDAGKTTKFSFIYVKPVDVYKTKKSWRSDDYIDANGKQQLGVTNTLAKYNREGNEHWFDDLTSFNDPNTALKKNPLKSIIVAQRYVLNWMSPTRYGKKYGEYSDALSALRMRNGIGLDSDGKLGDNHNQRDKNDFGQFNQTGNKSRDIDVSKAKIKTTNYLVGDDGNIKGEIPGDITKAISSPSKSRGPEKAVTDVLQGPALDAYIQAKKELDASFRSQNFLDDRVLCIVATCDGDSFYYIIDAIKTPIAKKSDINVNPEQLKQIAMDQLGQSFDEIQGFAN